MKFVQLTLCNSTQKIWVNLAHVTDMATTGMGSELKTTLRFGENYSFTVQEMAETILGIR